jgi:hypothetical protein
MASSSAVRTHCLDASALVKHYVPEIGSNELAAYLQGQPNWYTTPFCVFEGLNVLKMKQLRGLITPRKVLLGWLVYERRLRDP